MYLLTTTTDYLATASDYLAQAAVPDPPAKELPGKLGTFMNDLIGWGKMICLGLSVLGILAIGSMLAVGLRGRSDTAKNALGHLPYVILGTVLTGGSAGLIQAFQ
ncbi:hypothetical protein [Nocardia camponoti]|uniref:Uncharacterized protein n=1 Tax=Nocardia camponoti TaxID=1616106 RepID=A0A917VF88_9NOCA|nr:hypothetical protein [Nocardia camponoti]GGK68745.1 hypothetical protein GCM10011591_46070 [Nocardia camponoti]